ncbi:MAG: hypothetical protein JWL59_1705 [Chthoniobacteraceae bacterium]|nr:hypothetical protein [Chthoniobacteraceae bacterium]
MAIIPDLIPGPLIRDDDEGLFSRDINGQLVRLDSPTESDYDKQVTLQIDGQSVTVPLAEPLSDADGNIIVDLEGRTTPRYTTILDAATKLYVLEPGDEAKIPIPVLCHQPHMTPVAVCRLCVVQIYGQKRGKRAAERKLLPACQHQVKDGMEVFTMKAEGADGDRVRQTVKVMTELLGSNHLKPAENASPAKDLAPFNELGQMTTRCGADPNRYKLDVLSNPPLPAKELAGRRPFDASSPVFLVDHSACILCDRCVRACNEVMENNVIGRTGKGSNAGIGFDLNDPMGSSSCVQCGECMVSCPTSAITFKPIAQIKLPPQARAIEVLPAKELTVDPIFSGVPPKFLLWQQGLVVRRRFKAGEVLCNQGDAGNTAFIIKKGKLEVTVHNTAIGSGGLLGLFGVKGEPLLRINLTPADTIVGEMACMSGSPRSGTVTALEDGEVWEVRRNVLDRLMRLPKQRQKFEAAYRKRSLDLVLQGSDLFREMRPQEYREIVDYLRDRLTFVRVKPGQDLFQQGDRVTDLYMVRLGHVRIGTRRYGKEAKVISSGPGTMLGEIGLMALSPSDLNKTIEAVDDEIKAALDLAGDDVENSFPWGTSTATCSALGYLELARLSRSDFLQMIKKFRVLRRRLVEQSFARLRSTLGHPVLQEFVNQGMYEGQSILVLDMDLCVRCDECTKGCIDQHGSESHGVPIARMLRDGLRFDKFMVATSCRSCTDAHCMVGCPVDAIHRGKHLQIVIEDHCIGCGLCASNCPYGSISMMPNERRRIEVPHPEFAGQTIKIAQPKAVTCDLCDAGGHKSTPEPRCVAACPHGAASRKSGDELLQLVMDRW